jgi:hypothetical protein
MFFTNLQVFPGLPLQQVHYRYPQLLCCYRHVYYHRSLSGLTYLFLCGCEINNHSMVMITEIDLIIILQNLQSQWAPTTYIVV